MKVLTRGKMDPIATAYLCIGLTLMFLYPVKGARLNKVAKEVTWNAVDSDNNAFTAKISMELAGPAALTNFGTDKYRLFIQFLPVKLASKLAPSIYFSTIRPGSISLAIDDAKAHFKPNSQKLYYTVGGSNYTLQQQALGGKEYIPPTPPNAGLKAIVNVVIGQVGIAGDILDMVDIIEGFSTSSDPVWFLNTQNWSHNNLKNYDSSTQPQWIKDAAQQDNVFTDDATNDITTYGWNKLGTEANFRESISYWFEIVRDDPSSTPLYIRTVIPFAWDKKSIETRYTEIEWKVDLPSTTAQPAGQASLILCSTFDDHNYRNLTDYQLTIKLNGTQIYSSNPPLEHGKPWDRAFDNFKEFEIGFDKNLLKSGQNQLEISLSGVPSGDWICWDYFRVQGKQFESANTWSLYSPTGVDGVYGGKTKIVTFNY